MFIADRRCAASPFHSFWMGGYEGADHINGRGEALDLVRSTGHLARLDEDYRAAAALGLRTVRETIGWRLAEPRPGNYDLRRARRMAQSARAHGVQVLWTLMHYGTPGDVNLFDDAFIGRFADFAAAVAAALRPLSDSAPVYNLINEINFVAWAVSETNLLYPYRNEHPASGESSRASGYEIKRRLVRAVLAGMKAIRSVDPRARFLHVEPVVHTVAPVDQPELVALAEEVRDFQWQAFDLLCGRAEPALGGSPEALDLIGVNHYHSSQWEVGTERRLYWHERDPRRRGLAEMLRDTWERYRRRLIVAETSHVGAGRAAWLNDIASQVERARARGVPVDGLCLYPLVDRHDWNDPRHWHNSGLWDVVRDDLAGRQALRRVLNSEYSNTLSQWQLAFSRAAPDRLPMPYLIVFSHLRWSFVYQRPQHLLSRLAADYRILFIEEPVRCTGAARLDRMPQGPNIDVLVPRTSVDAGGFHDDQLSVLKPLLSEYLRENAIDDYLVWFYTPMALPLITEMRPRAVIYDCMDELSAFKSAPRQLRQREMALLKMADVVFTGGPALYEAKRDRNPNVHCLPSAVDADHFSPASLVTDSADAREADRLQAGIGQPRLGYFGVVDERLDLALLARLADARPDVHIVMVGPVAKVDRAELPQRPNIHWLGMQPYRRLPYLVATWDVCLMPFALNESTRYISPTKTLEYMAAEKPIVSTAVHDVVSLYGDMVVVANDSAEFIDACDEALVETGRKRTQRIGEAFATVSRFSWDRTADSIRLLIDQALHRPADVAPTPDEPARDAEHSAPERAPPAPSGGSSRRAAATGPARAPRHVRQVVIGAGPTGLSAAYHLGLDGQRSDTLLIEREARVGGWCRSVEQEGFTFDYAGHIMFSNDAHVLALYELLLGENVHWQNREAWIYSKGVYTRYPFQGSLYGLPPAVLKECLVGAIEARFGSLRSSGASAPVSVAPPANFEEFIQRVWGAGIARHFATPYNEKLWAVPLNEMETSWLGGRVPLPDLEQMIEGALEPTPAPMGPNARFGYPLAGGFQALMDGFLPHLNCELSLQTGVVHVSPAARTIRLDDGRSLRFDSLVSTMPLPQLVECCGDDAPADVRAAARALRHVSVRCVNLGIGREHLTEKHWIYYPEDTVFHRIFVQGNASPHCNPQGGFGLTCEITYGPNKPLPCDGAELIERVIADCRRVGIIAPDDPVLVANQIDMPCAYVVYDHARAANVKLIREWFDSFGIVLAGRYSEWEYYNSDHAFLAGRRAAGLVRATLGGDSDPSDTGAPNRSAASAGMAGSRVAASGRTA